MCQVEMLEVGRTEHVRPLLSSDADALRTIVDDLHARPEGTQSSHHTGPFTMIMWLGAMAVALDSNDRHRRLSCVPTHPSM